MSSSYLPKVTRDDASPLERLAEGPDRVGVWHSVGQAEAEKAIKGRRQYLRPILDRFGRSDLPLWWTEWGVSSHHGAAINDSAWAAPLVARGMRSAAGRIVTA